MRSTLAPAAVAAWLLASGCAADCKVNLKSNNPPTVAAGYSARLIASSLNTPRSIIFDKEGNLLVLEARNGIRRLTFSDDDGGTCLVEDLSKRGYVVASADLNHGIEISDDGKTLYASSPENVFSYAYNASETALDANRLLGTTLVRNMTNDDHVSRTLLLSKKQPGILLVSRGSASNIDPNAAQKSSGVSQIRAFNLSQLAKNQIYDYPSEGTLLGWGLRNSVGVAEHPVTGGIYSVENSADQIQRLGTDIHEDNPGEEMNFHGILNDSSSSSTTLLGANYGYPNCLALWSTSIPSPGSLSVGSQFTYSTSPENTTDDACNRDFIAPRLTFEAHTAPLDVKFNTTAGGDAAYVTFHGSWNRDRPAGYKLSVVAFDSAKGGHNLQDIRAKIFPLKRRKICAPEISPLASLPVKRKERSLSSLVVNTPKVSMQSGGLTGRRSKNVGRTAAALRRCNFGTEEPLKKEEDSGEDHTTSSSSSDYLKNVRFRQRRQDSSMPEPSNSLRHEHLKNNVEAVEGKADLWTPLNCLVEAANRTKSTKLNFQGSSMAKLEPSNVADGDVDAEETKEKALSLGAPNYGLFMPKARNKEHGSNPKAKDNHNNGTASLPETMKRKRLRATARNKAAASAELSSPAQLVLDASAAKCRRNSPIWFTLIASEDSFRKGGFPLPQISTPYLRIKDGKMPVSSIQKYLVKKLDLKSEAEVEILCRGQPVLPTQQLQNLVDLWFRTASTAKKTPASVGSSAKDFVMVLSYCRKVQSP